MKRNYGIIRKVAVAVCALGMMAVGTVWGQISFNHSKGKLSENTSGIPSIYYDYVNNLQQTHEYTKTVYVKAGQKKQLIPYQFTTNYFNTYYRWFLYNDDDDVTNLESYLDIESNTSYHKSNHGYLTTSIPGTNGDNSAFPYFDAATVPAGGVKIAFEASNDNEVTGITNETTAYTEPTLAYRYIFDVRDMNTFMSQITSNNEAYINNVRRTIYATEKMFFQVRLTQPLDNYYFEGVGYLDENDVTLTVKKNGQDFSFTKEEIYINNQDVLIIEQPTQGTYTVSISYNGTKLDEYQIIFLGINSAGMYMKNDIEGTYNFLSQKRLDSEVAKGNVKLLGYIDFDDKQEVEGSDFPFYLDHLDDGNAYYPWPILPWTQSSYAWMATRNLDYASYRIATTSASVPYKSYLDSNPSITPVYGHGDNVTGPGQDAFMYVNVANEPGKMLELDWDDQICPYTRIFLTFWINEFSHAESGNVEISVTGIRKDNKEHEALRTYVTGYVPKYGAVYQTTDDKGVTTTHTEDYVTYKDGTRNSYEFQHPLYNNGTDAPTACRGSWMQVSYSFIAEFNPTDYEKFVFTINNNTKNSGGADFAIDDIKIYAQPPTVVAQQTSQCDEIYNVDIRLPQDQLTYMYTELDKQQTGYFSFWEANDKGEYVPVHYKYSEEEGNENRDYGHFTFYTRYDQNPTKEDATGSEMFKYTGDDGLNYLGFNTSPTINDLEVGKDYIVTFFTTAGDAEAHINNGKLNTNEQCLIYSHFTVQRSQVVLIDGKPETDALSVCYNQRPTITPAMQIHDDVSEGEISDNYWYDGLYDVYKGSLDEYNETYQEAISHFRTEYPTAENPAEVNAKGSFIETDKKLLTDYADKFIFYCHSFTAEYPGDSDNPTEEMVVYTIVPITPQEESEIPDEVYCWDPYEFMLTFSTEAPLVNIGFPDVEYEDYTPCLRVGLDDLGQLKTQQLTIPLQNPTSGSNITTVSTNQSVYLDLGSESTNDPKLLEYLGDITDPWCDDVLVGTIQSLTATAEGNNNALIIKLDKLGTKVTFQEGYQYGFRLQYSDGSNACYGDLRFIIKVVPEYQFWLGSATDNWNNDENWVRAYATDMNNPSGYANYTTPYEHKGYVPMDFTKIVIPTEHNQVELYTYTTSSHTVDITTNKPSTIGENTENIELDLMVTEESTGFGCIPFYSNTVSEIHFEPNTEMLHTELLTYEKAWVDYELEKGRWYTLASPLQGVVAGDFYADQATGQEAQEYFTPISFDGNSTYNNGNVKNNRFNPSVYQRGWKGQTSLITTGNGENTGDSKNVAISGNWSSVYNDVKVDYSGGQGFSLKVQDIADGSSALFRLPKADDTYTYYNNDGTAGSTTSTITRNGTESKLYTDKVEVNLTTQDGTHYLVGNPYMAHINATKFFEQNPGLLKKYWLVDKDGQKVTVGSEEIMTSTDVDATIAPLQSFFVEKDPNATTEQTTVTFSTSMQTLGTDGNDNLRSTDVLYLTATTPDGKQSRAALAYNLAADKNYEASEDAELFLDSNLSDVPTVYTVAGTMATSINQTSELYNIPVGVYCAGTKGENVSLSFSNLGGFSYATLYDAETGTDTPLHEGSSFSVPANTNGRYFIRAGVPTANEAVQENAIRIYSVGGQLVIASTDLLQQVYIYDFAGRLVDSETGLHTTRYTTDLPAGNYMVKARSVSGEKTEKFKLRN